MAEATSLPLFFFVPEHVRPDRQLIKVEVLFTYLVEMSDISKAQGVTLSGIYGKAWSKDTGRCYQTSLDFGPRSDDLAMIKRSHIHQSQTSGVKSSGFA